MKISINITTFNRKYMTEFCINSLIKTTKRKFFDLIVVDNKSSDGTIEMLKYMKRENIIDKLILNPKNYHLGKAVNQAWDVANLDIDWLLWTNNDFFFMDGWLENFKIVINDLGKKIDYINCIYLEGIIRNKIAPGIPKKTKNGGHYLEQVLRKKKKFDVGAACIIRRNIVKKYNIKVAEQPFTKGYTGPGPSFYKLLYKLGLKGVRLDKPCILLQSSEYDNPEYYDYYNNTFGGRGLEKLLRFYKKHGGLKDPVKYYEGTDYLQNRKQYNK